MPDIAPASLATDPAPEHRPIARIFPIGVKDGPTVLIAVCTDSSIWELDRRGAWQGGVTPHGTSEWLRLPSIPVNDD